MKNFTLSPMPYFKISLTALLLFSFQLTIHAQTPPVIKVSNDGIIRLPEHQAVQNTYYLDVSHLDFQNDDDLIAFVKDKYGDSYLLRASSNPKTVIMVLKIPENPGRTKEQWRDKIMKESTIKPLRR